MNEKYKIDTTQDRRGWATAINKYDEAHGVAKSQRAKYDHQVWYFNICIVEGRDGNQMTVKEIQSSLLKYGIEYTEIQIKRGLRLMENPQYFVHPHIRGCGGHLVNVMKSLGGLQKTDNWGPNNPVRYWFGNKSGDVNIRRKIFGFSLL